MRSYKYFSGRLTSYGYQRYYHRVGKGESGIDGRFIIGAAKAFPGYELDDLFYVVPEASQDAGR